MQDFWFKYNVNDTYMITGYKGNEAIVNLPSSYYGKPVTIIYDNVFQNHPEITEIHFPDTITELGGFLFQNCTSLKKISLPPQLKWLWQYAFVRSSITEITIPDTVIRLVPFTFQECHDLQIVYLPNTLKRISSWTFKDCENLREIHLSRHTEIAENAIPEQAELLYID